MKSEFNVNLLIPYRRYKNLRSVFRVQRELNEIEAILLSFIYTLSNNNELKHKNFYEELFKTFNLEKDKWFDFIKLILNKMNGSELEGFNIDDNNLLCGEIKIIEPIFKKIEQHKFLGIDEKERKENINLNFAIFKDISNSEYTKQNLKNINDELVNNAMANLKEICIESWKYDEDIIDEDCEKNKKYNEIYINKEGFNINDIEIYFDEYKCCLCLECSDFDNVIIDSDEKKTKDIIDKYLNNNLKDLFLFSIISKLKISQFDEFSLNSKYNLIDINYYDDLINKIAKFNENFFIEKIGNFFIDEQNHFYECYKKDFDIIYNGKKLDKRIFLLISVNIDNKLDDFLIEQIKNDNIKNSDVINYSINKKKINDFIIKNIKQLISKEEIKKYILTNLVNYFNSEIIIELININSISEKEWNIILKNDINQLTKSIIQNINEYYKLIIDDQNQLWKIKKAFEFYELDLNNLENFKLTFFVNLNNFFKQYKNILNINDYGKAKKTKDELELKIKNEWDYAYQVIMHNNSKIISHINYLQEQELDHFHTNIIKLGHELDWLQKRNNIDGKNENLEQTINKIKNKELKNKLHEIRKFRNKYIHNEEINKDDKDKISELFKQSKTYIEYIKNNVHKIDLELKNYKSEKEE